MVNPDEVEKAVGEIVLIGGVEKRDIAVVAYDPRWPECFDQKRQGITRSLGPVALRIDHIGSTAVPGLPAKPIVDIGLCVPDAGDEISYLPALLGAGYFLRVRQPGHLMVRMTSLDVHVHVFTKDSDRERRHLLFRDWLRTDAADRAAYGRLKLQLAEREWSDMNAYAAAKDDLIAEITERAEWWALAYGWSPQE